MKNTVTSSIGGIAFHVEEDAHQKLSAYLDAIRRSLSNSQGREEIMADIEARIAELLQQRVKDLQQAVTLADVDEIISIMGSPDEFSAGEQGSGNQQQSQSSGTFYGHTYKRVFRDPDDKVIFGTCSGIAHHFGLDPLWIRLAFGISFIIGGFGFLLYILLTIIIPKARTSTERLEMRGEPIDINNIKKTVEEEMEDLKNRVGNMHQDFKSGRYRNAGRDFGRRTGDFFSSVGHGAGNVIGGIFKGIFAFIGFILIFIFSVMLIGLIVSLFSGVNVIHIDNGHDHWNHYSVHNLFTMLSITGTAETFMMLGLGLFIGIPLLALIIRIGRATIGFQQRLQGLRIGLFVGWMVGLVFLIIGSVQAFGHFSVTGTTREQVKFNTTSKTLYVNLLKEEDRDFSVKIDSLNFYVNDNDLFEGNPSICIQKSPDSSFHVVMDKYARGINLGEATESATAIEYNMSQHDSTLTLSSFYQLREGSSWRKQKLELTLLVPTNETIMLPKGVDELMCSGVHREHHHLGGHKWMMSPAGLVGADSAVVSKPIAPVAPAAPQKPIAPKK